MTGPPPPADSSAEFLAHVPLFAELEPGQLAELAERLHRERYARGELIFLRGAVGNSLFLVVSGTVKLGISSSDGKEFLLDLLGPGACFGELALLDGEPRSADAHAVEACQLYILDRADFLRYVEERPTVAIALLRVMSRRLRRDALVLEGAAFLDLPARLGRAILQLAATLGDPQADGSIEIPTRLTQSELAGLIGSTRESVNRWLVLYERLGWIHFKRGYLRVLRPDKLRERSIP